jgi:hypothetical protein
MVDSEGFVMSIKDAIDSVEETRDQFLGNESLKHDITLLPVMF